MCFSALSSFASGTVLTALGIASIRANQQPSQRLFAAIPLVFGLQQVAEGFVWRSLQAPQSAWMQRPATILYLLAAVVIWPAMVPLSTLLMERQPFRRRLLILPLTIGTLVSLGYGVGLVMLPVHATIIGQHILYATSAPPLLARIMYFAYLSATILPLYLSSHRRMIVFALVITAAYIVTLTMYRTHLVSVWCFLAALSSAVIWWIVREPVPSRSQASHATG